jgi:hypothetical protein
MSIIDPAGRLLAAGRGGLVLRIRLVCSPIRNQHCRLQHVPGQWLAGTGLVIDRSLLLAFVPRRGMFRCADG